MPSIAFYDRIQCIAKIRPLFLQLEPMRTLAGQLKKDRDTALDKVTIVEQEMDKVITKIQVLTSYCHSNKSMVRLYATKQMNNR